MTVLAEVLALATKDGRVCPMPDAWNRLWQMLPDRRRQGAGGEPPLPLILSAWWATPDTAKRERFHLHKRWASEHGALDAVAKSLSSMRPEDWHMGDQ